MTFVLKMPSKEELAARMNKRREASTTQQSGPREASPYWPYRKLMKNDTTALLRFLPDLDQDNPDSFFAHRKTIRLRFDGAINGEGATKEEVVVTVPSMEMYPGEKCPIAQYIRSQKWWDSADKKELALKYYRRHEYVLSGFVVSSPFEENPAPENPIRVFIMPKKGVGEAIEDSVVNPEIEDLVINEIGGREFRLKKTKSGDWPDYTGSTWSMKTRALTDVEMAAIEQYGLVDLRSHAWGRKPDEEEKEVILAMFHDSLNGNPFDISAYSKWYKHYENKPYANEDGTVPTRTAPASSGGTGGLRTPPAQQAEKVAEKVTETAAATSEKKVSAAELIAKIKAKTAAAS